MSHNLDAVRRLYIKLLSLYPPAFRERLGESMQQTFDDLYRERISQSGQGVTRFVAWLFLDTAVGIIQEHLRLISPGELMRALLKITGLSALISVLFIVPFAIMEIFNRREFNEGFPYMLFFALWFNLFAILLILLPILRSRRAGNQATADAAPAAGGSLFTHPLKLVIVGFLLFTFAAGWTSLVIDQWPCFIGVPVCD